VITVYDLIDRFGRDATRDWLSGDDVDGLGCLDQEEAHDLARLWPFWARPGQRWTPGPETITYYSCGRGYGKSFVLSHVIGEAALEPERWGHSAMLIGITPNDVRSLIEQSTGIVAVAEQYGYPAPEIKWTAGRGEMRFAGPAGGPGIAWRFGSSAKPATVRGPNVGLLLADEWAFFDDARDQQGYTAWEAAMNALRVGEQKAVIVSSPSRRPEVTAMRRDALEPVCHRCSTPGHEHRLPPLQPKRISPLFSTSSSEPVRVCDACGGEVIATVRIVFGSTLDNVTLQGSYVDRARRMLATGTKQSRGEFGGEIIDDDGSTPIPSITIHDMGGFKPFRDPWRDLLRSMEIDLVIVMVDPAVTASEGSAETGVIAAGVSRRRGLVYALEDRSLPPGEVIGSPSRVWAQRAAVLAAFWRASEVVIETNQGGLEVLHPARLRLDAVTLSELRDEAEAAGLAVRDDVLAECLGAARRCEVDSVTRRASKAARWDWASPLAASGDLACLRAPWLDADHWQRTREHLTRFVPPSDERKARQVGLIDRGDTLIAAAQRLLGAREVAGEEGLSRVVDPAANPLYRGGLFG